MKTISLFIILFSVQIAFSAQVQTGKLFAQSKSGAMVPMNKACTVQVGEVRKIQKSDNGIQRPHVQFSYSFTGFPPEAQKYGKGIAEGSLYSDNGQIPDTMGDNHSVYDFFFGGEIVVLVNAPYKTLYRQFAQNPFIEELRVIFQKSGFINHYLQGGRPEWYYACRFQK